MTASLPTSLTSLLKRTGLLSDAQIAALLMHAQQNDMTITRAALAQGFVAEDAFLEALAAVLNVPFVRLGSMTIEAAILEKLPTRAVFQYNVIPLAIQNGALQVATNDPFDTGLMDALRLASGMRVKLALALHGDIGAAIKKFYGVGADTVEKLMQEGGRIEVAPEETLLKTDLSELDQEASIVRFVNQIIWEAYQERATDIHLEPMENQLRIRYRVDGVLHQTPLPAQLTRFQAAILSRIKVMANMDIAEKRLPQDGRIGMRIQGEDIDIRVSTMPTVYGESVSLRLLMRGKEFIGFRQLGLRERDEKIMRKLIERPNGIILVTGPTGSGKSTSLYAYLHEINTIDQRIITVEDPIEYEMAGINQINVKADIGLTFATALRHILRQDPDIIMIGEIRDFETAEIAIRASLTGHLVFSTLHTNDAAGAVTRLLDMGVEPFLVASSLEAVVAQRLVRRLCQTCRRPATPDRVLLSSAGFPVDRLAAEIIHEGVGCEKCRSTGFRGRMGIYEVLQITEGIEPLILQRSSSNAIKQKAVAEGMMTLRDDGWGKVLDGQTTVEEVLRVTEEME
jgi:general secretion pathway protein E/type IV pilus assembly protein PilB